MPDWKEVKGSGKPNFDETYKIDASHSVVAAMKGKDIYWIRFDYHNPEDFKWWPLNWSEVYFSNSWEKIDNHPGWHLITAERRITEFSIDVTTEQTPWPVPKPTPIAEMLTFPVYT